MLSFLKKKIYDLSVKYSQKVGLDLPYFVKNGFRTYLAQFSNMGKFFLLSIFLTKFLSQEQFGQWSFIKGVLGIASVTALPALSNAVVQGLAKHKDGMYFKAIKLISKTTLLGGLGLLGFALYSHVVGRDIAFNIFLLLGFLYPLYAIGGYFPTFFIGKEMFDKQAKTLIIYNIFQFSFTAGAIFFTKDLTYSILAFTLSHIVVGSYFSLFYVRKYIFNNDIDKKTFQYGIKTSFSSMFGMIGNNFDKIILGYFLGFEELAIYVLAMLLPDQAKTATQPLTQMFLPKLSRQEDLTKQHIYKHMIKLFIIAIILILVYILVSPFIFKWFYPDYLESTLRYSQIFMVSFITFPSIILLSYLKIKERIKAINLYNIVTPILFIILPVIGILLWGLLGAIVGRMIARSLCFMLNLYLVYKD